MALEAPRHISETCQKWLLAFSPLGIHVHRVPEALSGFVRGGSRQESHTVGRSNFQPTNTVSPLKCAADDGKNERKNEQQQINWGFHNP